MQFAEFADRAREMEAEAGDIETTLLVRDLFLAAAGAPAGSDEPDDLPVLARFVQGRVFPAWRSETLDIGPSLCYEAIARAAGPNVTAADVEDRLAETGEIGEVA
ncbi:DNA ligase, partial [Halobium palmae]